MFLSTSRKWLVIVRVDNYDCEVVEHSMVLAATSESTYGLKCKRRTSRGGRETHGNLGG